MDGLGKREWGKGVGEGRDKKGKEKGGRRMLLGDEETASAGDCKGGREVAVAVEAAGGVGKELGRLVFLQDVPDFQRDEGKECRGAMPRVVETKEERGTRETLALLYSARNEDKGSVRKVMTALEIMKVRGDCASGWRKKKKAAPR